jgi:diguanylate cyclase (GGDEF)-like protein
MPDTVLKILLVEDNPGDARLLRALVAEVDASQWALTHVEHLNSALEQFTKARFDLILLDLSLPDSQGLDTFHRANAHAPDMPIVVLTGLADESLAVQAIQAGAQDYLVKGQVQGNALVRAMRYAIERQRLCRELERVHALEHHLMYHDALTGLPNRQLLYDRLHQAVLQAKRGTHLVAVLFLDLDGFKRVNDSFSHSAGDCVLQSVAQRLTGCLRESDTVARLSGDEFVILLSGIAQIHDAVKVTQKILHAFSHPFAIDDHDFFLTTSIGISLSPSDGEAPELLVQLAGMAMDRAKKQGKNTYQFTNQVVDTLTRERLTLENRLRKALENGELTLYYQPQVNLHTGSISGVEALVRWQHPETRMIPPANFLPIAEETGLIVSLDTWVLRAACTQNTAWQEAGFPPVRVAVNLSAHQFREKKLLETVTQVLADTGLRPDCLELEITEGNAMQDVEYTIATLQALKEIGVQLAVDDFGTGYSSLSYLKRFPIDRLKIGPL